MPNPGDAITLSLQLANGDASKYPLAHVYNDVGTEVSGSPFALTAVGTLGLYMASAALTMPSNTDELKVQYICYDNSGHSVQSTDQPIVSHVFRNNSPPDTKINLTLQLFDGAAKYPLVHVYDNTGAEIAGSPIALTQIANGLYYNKSLSFPSALEVVAQYQVFDDSGHNTPTAGESIVIDEIFPISGGTYTDPGASNVRSGVSYTFNNVVETGTYKGAGFNTDPGVSNVSVGTSYEILGNNLTGTRNVVTNYISQATLSGPPNQAAILKADDDD